MKSDIHLTRRNIKNKMCIGQSYPPPPWMWGTPGLLWIIMLKGDSMSSIFKGLVAITELVLGNGDIKSNKQGFVMILLDKVLEMIAKVLKS